MIVISDTTPIIALIKINRIDLLEKLFGEVLIPEAVFDELKSDVLIMDEKKGRKVAQQLGIVITGTIGILIQAHDEGMASSDEIKLYLEQLKNSNIRLSDSLIQQTLAML